MASIFSKSSFRVVAQLTPNVIRLGFALLVTLVFIIANLCMLMFAEDKTPEPSKENIDPKKALQLKFEAVQNIYSSRQGVMIRMELLAKSRVKVCLAKDIMSQLQVKVNRAGVNQPLKPLVVNDNSNIFHQPTNNRWMDPGEKVIYHINLKRFRFADGSQWIPAEYSANATYLLCPQTKDELVNDLFTGDKEPEEVGEDIPIKSSTTAWFMIMS